MQKDVENAIREAMQLKDYRMIARQIQKAEKIGLRSPTLEQAKKMMANARDKLE